LKLKTQELLSQQMTQEEFAQLDDNKQAAALIDRGVFLTERMYKNFSIFLYCLDDFYVEIFHNLRFNVMQGMRSFRANEDLDPYLETIDISAVYQY
jgi:hypothetical protein